jgi:hypothetical protein
MQLCILRTVNQGRVTRRLDGEDKTFVQNFGADTVGK